ncbi:cytochrome P450 302a1, mitochondrial [Venturia canescens]|uniref:cytochrome P450 302a1, mitochondrial n=1 Tax=Venturia canescens TaxID=32260 RepID=UPI001C9BF849|nr:cytochrome P450 302a1, mitochondrial [Venturia canescens]XP_043269590.1 cytochrome P450 302a1, mitochondrial [Venturia canescens]XP_043269591.1 cytochrome P450 302a1, mitochondrial [Venturia canescens]
MYPRSYLNIFREKTFRLCHSKATNTARPFQDIPGPKALPIVGTLHKYLPFIGEYSFDRLHVAGAIKLAKYGPLVREEFVPGESTVWVFKPDDIAEVYKSEVGSYPERRSHLALLKYRKDRSNVYNTGGLLPTNGAEWWRIRKEFQKDLSKPRCIVNYVESADEVVSEFVELCGRQKHEDLLPLLSRLFLELTCLVAFDERFNSFSKEEMTEGSRSSKLIEAAIISNSAVLKLDNGPRLWRYFNTPLYRKMIDSQQYMEKVAVEMVSQKLKLLEKREKVEKESLLETYLKNPNLDVKDVVGMACDMLLAGIDTTSYSISYVLYHLGRNLEAQEKLSKEAVALLPNPEDSLTSTALRSASYTKAAIKETFRLNPISVGVGRVLQNDVILSGYHVPKGTAVVTQNQIICRLPEYFPEPDSFLPERWMRDNDDSSIKKPVNPHLVLPFGHGMRSCIARRLAEQNMQIILLKLCRRYKFIWEGGKLDWRSLLINKPDGPINLRFYER